jgi:hypothetical protein
MLYFAGIFQILKLNKVKICGTSETSPANLRSDRGDNSSFEYLNREGGCFYHKSNGYGDPEKLRQAAG